MKPFFLLLAGALAAQGDARAPEQETPSGTLFVLAKRAGVCERFDLATGRRTGRWEIGPQPHEALVPPGGRFLFASLYGSGEVARLSLDGSSLVERFAVGGKEARPHGLATRGDSILVTAEGMHRLLAIDPSDGERLFEIETDQEIAHMVVVTPDGRYAFTANIASGTLARFDLEERRQDAVVRTGAGAEGIALSPDGREVWVTNRADDSVSVVSASSMEVAARLECASFPIRCAFTPDGSRVLVTCARSGEVAVFDARDRKEVGRLDLGAKAGGEGETLFGEAFAGSPVPIGLVIEPSGRFAYVACSAADRVVEIHLPSLEPTRSFATAREPDGLALLAGERDG